MPIWRKKWAKRGVLAAIYFLAAQSLSMPFLSAHAAEPEVTQVDLARALAFYRNVKSLEVGFEQRKMLKSIGMNIDSSGVLRIDRKPPKIVWTIHKPAPLQVVLTEQEIRITSDYGKPHAHVQVIRTQDAAAGENKKMSAMYSWLRLDAAALHREYRVIKKADAVYRFTPRQSKDSPFTAMIMHLGVKGVLKGLRLEERSGDSIQINFAEPKVEKNAT